jgi:hypothetical protein
MEITRIKEDVGYRPQYDIKRGRRVHRLAAIFAKREVLSLPWSSLLHARFRGLDTRNNKTLRSRATRTSQLQT